MNKLYILIILSCLLFTNNLAQASSPLVSVDWVKNNLGKNTKQPYLSDDYLLRPNVYIHRE